MASISSEHFDAYRALQATFGPRTDSIIDMLQPSTDLATKTDVELMGAQLRTEIQAQALMLERRMSEGFQQQTRTLMLTVVGALIVFVVTGTVQGFFV